MVFTLVKIFFSDEEIILFEHYNAIRRAKVETNDVTWRISSFSDFRIAENGKFNK